MLSVLVLPTCFCSVASADSLSTPPTPLTPAAANNSFIRGFRKATEERKVGLNARREVIRRAETENSRHTGLRQSGKDVLVDQSERGTIKAPSRDSEGKERDNVAPLVQERIADGLVRRYWLDELSGTLRIEEVKISSSKGSSESHITGVESRSKPLLLPAGFPLPKIVTDFVLPAGFPDSVSSDYLQYMLWQFPTNVTGWICSTLVTSSLFKAVGVGVGGGYAAAATATIKWVMKDGLGALGLILIGGRFGSIFDEDPKQWRLYADFIGSAGSIFELCTPLAPDQFLLLGSLGYLFKAVAKGLKDPSFRVIQNHFAASENVGDVSAKEEVWEVSAKLIGLAIAVLLLGMPALSDSYWKLVLVWTSLRSLHLWLRYQSLAGVQFPTINYRRAAVLVESHLQGYTLPGCEECNRRENLLVWWQLKSPRVRIGCSLKDVLDSSSSAIEVEDLLTLYSNEEYVLVLHRSPVRGPEARVLVKEEATSLAILRSLWQAYWLLLPSVADSRSSSSSESSTSSNRIGSYHIGPLSLSGQLVQLDRSLGAMNNHFDSFLRDLQGSGWDLDQIVLKVPSNAPTVLL